MANYPIKLLKDETNAAFVPLVSTDCIRDKDNQTLQQMLDKKLSPTNLLPGEHVSITTEGNNCYVGVDLPAGLTLIDNLNTTTANQGSLDAHQGKVLKDMIPEIIDDITDTSPTKGLSANQGYLLNNKFNNYTTTTDMNNKFSNYSLLSNTPQTPYGDTKISWLQLAYNNKWQLYLKGNTNGADKDFYIDLLDSPSSNDTGWIKVTEFLNGASNWNVLYPICYRKIGKTVYLNGLLKGGNTGAQFVLPEGFRPRGVYNCWIVRYGTSWGRIFVNYSNQDGTVYCEGTPTDLEIPLNGISFVADY